MTHYGPTSSRRKNQSIARTRRKNAAKANRHPVALQEGPSLAATQRDLQADARYFMQQEVDFDLSREIHDG